MQLFTNNADSVLNGALAEVSTSLVVKAGDGAKFPNPTGGDFFLVTLYQKVGTTEVNHEIVKCTTRSTDTLTIVRAQEGTTAKVFADADPIELRATAGAMLSKQDLLVSATNIRTINGTTVLGSGNLAVGTVTSVTGTAPVVSSGGTTPDLSMAAATASVSGYLAAADFATFNAKQSAGTYATGTGSASGTNTGDQTVSSLGLGNVSNTSDANKPVSTAQQTALNLKADLASPAFSGTVTGITAAMVGLGSVNNTADADKPVSSATATALSGKQAAGSYQTAGTYASGTGSASGTNTGDQVLPTALSLGLNNVSNTADADKPVSTATVTAIGVETTRATTAEGLLAPQVTTYTKTQTEALIAEVVGTSPGVLNTISLINAQLTADETAAASLVTAVSLKAPMASPTFTGTVLGVSAAMVGAPAGSGTSSGANTGDETLATIKTKLGVTVLSGSNTGDQTLPTLASLGAQAAGVYASGTGSASGTNTGDQTASSLGLGSVSNTADADKPVSTAQAAADTAVLNAAASDATSKANARQATLVSGTNIKTVGGVSLLGAGDAPFVGAAIISETPPASPVAGNLWWDSVAGALYLYYNDGSSQQWVATARVTKGDISIAGGKPSLSGPTSVYINQTLTYLVTNYNVFSTYSVSVSAGSVSIIGNTITIIAPSSAQTVTLTVTTDNVPTTFALVVLGAGVATPTITSPANGATGEFDGLTLTSSAFAWLGVSDTHASSDWQLSTDAGFITVVQSSLASTSNKTSWSVSGLSVSTTYYARVKHTGAANGSSTYSATVSFVTASAFGSFIATPAATPSTFGAAFEGGFYMGLFWNQIAQAANSKALATGTQTFTVADMTSTPLVYAGQTLEVRSRANPANKFIGTVTGALGTTLTLNVSSIEGSGTYSDWSVMSRFRNIVAPKSSGENAYVLLATNPDYTPIGLPTACQTLTEGWEGTLAMAAGSSANYPAAHWARALVIGGKNDWHIPARDVLELSWRNGKPTTANNYFGGSRSTAQSFDYKNAGSYGDTAASQGLNNNTSPTGAAYTSSLPAQTSATAFQTGGTEAYEFGAAYYLSCSSYENFSVWTQLFHSGYPGYQSNGGVNSSNRIRAVRRSII